MKQTWFSIAILNIPRASVLHLLIVAHSEVHALEEQLRQEEEPHISWDICINKKSNGAIYQFAAIKNKHLQ